MTIKNSVILLALGASIVAGCSKDSAAPEAVQVEPDPVKRRMQDPAYVQKLNDLNSARKEIMKEMTAAQDALHAAKAASASEAELAKLQAEVDKCAAKMKQHMLKARQAVATQIKAAESK